MILEFVEVHLLDIGPLSDMPNGTLGINGFEGVFSWSLVYIIIRIQVEGFNNEIPAVTVKQCHTHYLPGSQMHIHIYPLFHNTQGVQEMMG